jgi:hypothetical protein
MLYEIQTKLFVQMNNDFRITIRAKLVALLLQLTAELTVVVDFAVERDLHRAIFVSERLRAA